MYVSLSVQTSAADCQAFVRRLSILSRPLQHKDSVNMLMRVCFIHCFEIFLLLLISFSGRYIPTVFVLLNRYLKLDPLNLSQVFLFWKLAVVYIFMRLHLQVINTSTVYFCRYSKCDKSCMFIVC